MLWEEHDRILIPLLYMLIWTLGCFLLEEPASQYELDQSLIYFGAQVRVTLGIHARTHL